MYIFDIKENVISYDELAEKLKNKKVGLIEKRDALTYYLISVWIHGTVDDKFYSNFKKYVQDDKSGVNEKKAELSEYGFDHFWLDSSLSNAVYKLHELGYFEEHNKFRIFLFMI